MHARVVVIPSDKPKETTGRASRVCGGTPTPRRPRRALRRPPVLPLDFVVPSDADVVPLHPLLLLGKLCHLRRPVAMSGQMGLKVPPCCWYSRSAGSGPRLRACGAPHLLPHAPAERGPVGLPHAAAVKEQDVAARLGGSQVRGSAVPAHATRCERVACGCVFLWCVHVRVLVCHRLRLRGQDAFTHSVAAGAPNPPHPRHAAPLRSRELPSLPARGIAARRTCPAP